MESCGVEKEKTEWMYNEVRYAKVSSGFGDNKTMFKLEKDGKKIRVQEYQDGLETHFQGDTEVTNISMDDVKNILWALES